MPCSAHTGGCARRRAFRGRTLSSAEFLTGLFGLDGRVALITGARQGIGDALAEGLARAGAAVALTSRDVTALEPLVERLHRLGAEAVALELEVGDPAAVDGCVAATIARFGRLDIAVNNAGVTAHSPALTLDLAEWDHILRTNTRGAFLVARAAAREMKTRGGGRIVNLSSPFARVAVAGRAAYSASKAALEQLTRSLAVEWAGYGITVNAVAPTTVLTESRRALFADKQALADRVAQIPLGRLAEPGDVVGAVLFLCADAGSFVTGETLLVDGGYTVRRG